MMMNWHDGIYPRTISQALQEAGPRWAAMFHKNEGLAPKDAAAFAHDCGMSVEPLGCYTLNGWLSMLRSHGPFAVIEGGTGWLHARILLGIELAGVQPVGPTAGAAAGVGAIAGATPAATAVAPSLGVLRTASRSATRGPRALIVDPAAWDMPRYYEDLDQYIETFENLDAWVKRQWMFGKTTVMEAKIWHY
jgi:hypothetical protein